MTKPSDSWMPIYVEDYLRDTQRLNAGQHGAYLLIIMDYWVNGPPPDDDEVLATITKSTKKGWQKLRQKLHGFFRIEGGVWRHKRVDHELDRAHAIIEQRQAAGRASAQARANKRANGKANETSTGVATGEQREANETVNETPTKIQTLDISTEVPRKVRSLERVAPLRNTTTHKFKNLTSLTKPLTARASACSCEADAVSSTLATSTAESETEAGHGTMSRLSEEKALNSIGNRVSVGRSAPSAPDGALDTAEVKRNRLQQKLLRFCRDTLAEPQLSIAIGGLCGADPNPKHGDRWWLNRLDKLRKAQGWNDATPSRRKTRDALGHDPGPNPNADEYAFRQAASALAAAE